MGCCQSTPGSDSHASPYSPSNAHGDSSSRAITSIPTPVPESHTPRISSHIPTTSHSSRPRALGLAEQFNKPLQPHVWTSKKNYTRSELDREREEFFDTRVTGRAEIWATLRVVVGLLGEGDIGTAQSILDASGVTVPTGDLINGAYDEMGNLYQIPDPVISDPENLAPEDATVAKDEIVETEEIEDDELERRKENKGKTVMKGGESFKVKARLSDRGGLDVVIMLSKEDTVRTLVRKIKSDTGLPVKGKVKIAYMGKILKDGETLKAQGWHEGHVLNALVF